MLGFADIHDPDAGSIGILRSPPREVHKDISHQPRRHCDEVGTVLPTDILPIQQAYERLVDEGRCLKDVSWTLAPEVPTSKLTKLRFDEWDELVECRTFPVRHAMSSSVTCGDVRAGAGSDDKVHPRLSP